MIFSKPSGTIFLILAYLLNYVVHSAYQMTVNGQTYQVNVVSEGIQYGDRMTFTDDYGDKLDSQSLAICSSLRGEICDQITNNGARKHSVFNYFPNHAQESIIAYSNSKYDKNTSPYLMKQAIDERTLKYLSKQNPNNLGNGPAVFNKKNNNNLFNANNVLNSINNNGINLPLNLLTKKKIKINKDKKPKNNQNNDINDENDENEYADVDVEIYSNIDGDNELADALGLDEGEFGDTVDRIVAQLISSYLDNDSDEVDVSQVFANELSGDVTYDQINLEQRSVGEMRELLNNIKEKHKKLKDKKDNDDNQVMDPSDDNDEVDENDIEFQIKFIVGTNSNENDNDNDIDNDDEGNNDGETQNPLYD